MVYRNYTIFIAMNNLWYQCYQLITTVNDFAECLNEGGQCDVLTLDFSKAFDKVPHARLYQKLSLYGIRGPILTWLQAFLTRSQHVIVVNMKNLATHVLSGVPQGTVLAPLLILIYIYISMISSALYSSYKTYSLFCIKRNIMIT